MDILQYFHLNEHPFRIGPDPRFLYLSEQVKEAIAKCEYMARERIGPIYIYGPIGAGKTSLLRRLYERLGQDDKYNLALLISPNVKSSNAFLRMMMEAYDVRIAFDAGQTRSLATNILGRQAGMNETLLKTILAESGKAAKANITRRTPQISELIDSVEQWITKDNGGD